jgi:hypothetical protein
MSKGIFKIFIAAVAAIAVVAPTKATIKSKAIVIETPSDLPELARVPTEAMFLYQTHEAQVILYLEQDQGRKLGILDVTDPANVKAVGQISINAPALYDFVQYLGSGRTLIHYRNHTGFAVLNFKDYKMPVLTAEPEYLHPATAEPDGSSGLLLVSPGSSASTAPKPAQEKEYEVFSVSSGSGAAPLATIQNVIQRVDRAGTGTIFLLTDQGVTEVRYLAAEREHQIEVFDEDRN